MKRVVLLVLAVVVLSGSATPSFAAEPETTVATMPDFVYGADFEATGGYTLGAWNNHQVYKALIYWGVKQGLTPEQIGRVVGTVQLESGFNPYALADTPYEYSVGPAQFNRRGGLWWSLPPGREGYSDWNAAQQMRAITWAIKNGYGYHWTGYRMLYGWQFGGF